MGKWLCSVFLGNVDSTIVPKRSLRTDVCFGALSLRWPTQKTSVYRLRLVITSVAYIYIYCIILNHIIFYVIYYILYVMYYILYIIYYIFKLYIYIILYIIYYILNIIYYICYIKYYLLYIIYYFFFIIYTILNSICSILYIISNTILCMISYII